MVRAERESPALLLPLGAALITHALAKENYLLPPLVFLLLVAGYWLPSPSWWKGRVPLYLAAAALAGPAYLYQRAFMTNGAELYILSIAMVDMLGAMAAVFVALLWYLPPGQDRNWGLILMSFALIALSGNLADPPFYLPGLGVYFLALLLYFKLEQKRSQKDAPRPGLGARVYYVAAYCGFLGLTLALGGGLAGIMIRSGNLLMDLGLAMGYTLYTGGSLKLSSSWRPGDTSGLGGSDMPILTLTGTGPIPDHLRSQVYYTYSYDKQGHQIWLPGEKSAPRTLAAGPSIPLNGAAGGEPAWRYRLEAIGTFDRELPLPRGSREAAAQFNVVYYPAPALLELAPEAKKAGPRAFELAGGEDPLPSCGDTCVAQALQLPDHLREALRPKALAITAGAKSDRERAAAIVRHFSAYNYSTRDQGRTGEDTVLEFMQGDTATGLCSDFANAGALLLRAVDVPVRTVSGLLVEEPSGPGEYTFYLKERDKHVWLEVFCREDRQWVEFDPTPAGAMQDAFGLNRPWLRALQKQMDRFRVVLRRLSDAFRNLTLEDVLGRFTAKNIALGVGTILLIILAIYLLRRRRSLGQRLKRKRAGPRKKSVAPARPAGPLTEQYLRFLALLERRGLFAGEPETGSDILKRISPDLGLPLCAEFVAVYNATRFRAAAPAEVSAAAARLAELLARLEPAGPRKK